jgi:hypothetical protein
MTTFDMSMILGFVILAVLFGLWIWIMADWIRFMIKDRRDRRDSELMATWIMKMSDSSPGLDTQIGRIRNGREFRNMQDFIPTRKQD